MKIFNRYCVVITIGLSKNLRDALKYLATQDDVAILRAQLSERLELHVTENAGPVEFNVTPDDPINWSEGVEHLHKTSTSELYAMLGFGDHKIPFLNSEIDCEPDVSQIARASHGDPTPPAPPPKKEPLSLRWHQLVGVVKMMECALTSQPVLLMDDVGLGKTIQVLAFFCVLAYYRDYYRAEKTYPGLWGRWHVLLINCDANVCKGSKTWQDFAGKLGGLPELPFLFVVPPTLVNQVVTECVRFLQSGSFDIVPYTAGYKTHKSVWDVIEKRSHTVQHMRIYVASSTVCHSHCNDFIACISDIILCT
ncbi:hypothetical protein EDB84DRAFT_1281323 [Lactarius hengduanensis]|nr:hypothetical protein EDB84DRAFT_1281323 [Lactarius hengduanensis]